MTRRSRRFGFLTFAALSLSAFALLLRAWSDARGLRRVDQAANAAESRADEGASLVAEELSATSRILRPRLATEAPAARRPVSIRLKEESGNPIALATVGLEYRFGQYVHMPVRRFLDGANRHGEITTDAQGGVLLTDPPPGESWLVGRVGEFVGILDLDASYFGRAEMPPLVMRPVRRVEVAIADSTGAPVPGLLVEAMDTLCFSPAQGWTDDGGIARFEVTCIDRAAYEAREIRLRVYEGFPFCTFPPGVPWATGSPTRIPVVVKPCVIARITVLDDAQSDPPSARTLRWKEPGDHHGYMTASGDRPFTGSRTAVAALPSGLPVTFTVEEPGRRPSSATASLAPQGESSEILIQRGLPSASVRVRVIEADGEPVPNARMFVQAEATPVLDTETDAMGTLAIDVESMKPGALRLHRADFGLWSSPDASMSTAIIEYPAVQPSQPRDVVARLPECPLVVSVAVVDDAGAQVPGAFVTLEPWQGRGPPDNLGWVVKRTGPDGTIAFRGVPPPGRMTLVAEHPMLGRSDRVDLDPASHGCVRLTLFRFGSLVGKVSSATGEPLTLKIEPAGGPTVPAWRPSSDVRSITVPTNGEFAIAGLPSGAYVVRLLIQDVVALTVENIRIAPEVATRDPRIEGVVVGSRLLPAVVIVRGPDGAPIESASVKLFAEDAAPEAAPLQQRLTTADGSASFLLPPGERVLVRVKRGDHVTWRQTCDAFPTEVVLKRQLEVEVAIESSAPLATSDEMPGYVIRLARIVPCANHDFMNEHDGYLAPSHPVATVKWVDPGDYHVYLATRGEIRSSLGVSPAYGQWIELGDIMVTADQPPPRLSYKVIVSDTGRVLRVDR